MPLTHNVVSDFAEQCPAEEILTCPCVILQACVPVSGHYSV